MDIEDYRQRIDTLNEEIVEAVARRRDIAVRIGELKQQHGQEVEDSEREQEVIEQFRKLFKDHNLPQERSEELATLLIDISKEAQQ